MSKKYGVLWDVDHTMVKSKEVTSEVISVVFPEFGCDTPSSQQIHSVFGIHLDEMLADLSDNHPDQEQIINRFLEEQSGYYREQVDLFEGILEGVAELGEMKIKQGIVTTRGNKKRGPAGAVKMIKKAGLKKHIQAIVTPDDVKQVKPDPAPLYYAMGQLGVRPENTIMIGDQRNDMLAAKSAGALALGLVHDEFPYALEFGVNLLDAGADAVRYHADSIVPYVRSVFDIE